MALTGGRRIVRDLWEAGERHGRVPDPTPEVDPWEDEDPYGPPSELAVVFGGSPALTVRLYLNGEDTVTVEDSVDLEVPRVDTVAVVEAILGGQARMRMHRASFLARLIGTFAHAPMLADLVVRLPEVGRTYTAPVLQTYGQGAWISRIPWEE